MYLSCLSFLPPPANADGVIVAATVTPTTNVAAVNTATIARVLVLFVLYYKHYNVICIFEVSKLMLIYLI